jgi:nicotinamidase-related amidase/predicted MFS family arabinose efflux permease
MRGTFTSLRTRNFRLFFIGQTISNTGNWLTNIALTLLVLHLTHSGLAVGLLTAAQYGPILLFSIHAGAVADRHNKRTLLFVTQGLEMAESIVLAALAFTHHPPLVALYATAAVGGSLLALDNPLRRSFVTEMVPVEDRANAVVLYSLIVNVARVFGPALAGVLAITVGYGWCFTIDAASYVVVLAALKMMRPAELHRGPPPSRAKGQIRAGLRYVADTPNLWISFVMLAAVGLLSYNFNVTLPLFATRTLRGGDSTFTLLYSTFSAGAVVSALVIANKNLVHLRHIIMGSVGLGLAMLGLAVVPNTAAAVPVAFLVGLASILYMTSTTAIIQVETDPALHGRILALQTFILGGTLPIGGPILGWMADALGARAPIVLGGIVCLGAAAFGLAARRVVRRRALPSSNSKPDRNRSPMALSTLDTKPALVVIDLQKGIVAASTVHPVDDVVKRAASLATAFRRHQLPVVLVNVAGRAPGRTEIRPPNLTPAPDWADLIDELQPQAGDHRVTKLRWGAFHGTSLDAHLQDLGVTQIVLAGVSTSIGVESTARSAYEHGYHVVLATDAMTDTDAAAHDNSIQRIFPRLGETATTAEIVDMLDETRS